MTTAMAWAMPRACSETSEPKSDLATISSVRVHHVGVDVAEFRLAFHPASIDSGGLSHDLGVGDDVFVAEGWLDELSLRLPELAFAGEQAVAEDGAEGAVVARLEEIVPGP